MDDIDKARANYKKEGYALIRYDDKPVHSYPYDAPWMDDKKFIELYEKIRGNTLVDRNRCYALWLLIQQVQNVAGEILEVGTWRGGTAGIFTRMSPSKIVYLADTFKGVVKASEWEHYNDKAHDDTSIEVVEELLEEKLQVKNYKILNGIFPEETGKEVKGKKWAFVYLDVDVYQSTKDAFNYVWEDVSAGGVVAFDDYGFISACGGIKKFVDEIRDDRDKLFLQNLNGQAYIVKLA